MSSGANSSGGIFSSITSLFGSASLGEGSTSTGGSASGGYLDRKRSALAVGLPSARRAQQLSLSEGAAFNKSPYSPYGREPNSSTSPNGAYPPVDVSTSATGDFPGFGPSSLRSHASNVHSESTSTLVPGAQSRASLSLSTNVSIPSTAYPPLKHTWRRIRTWCNKNYTELTDTLNWPATEAQLDDLELTIGYSLPPAVRDSYLCYDGQELESNQSCNDGLFFGLPLLSIDRIADEWRFWRNVDDDPSTGANPEVKGWMCSCPAGWVRSEYSCRGWIPLITDHVGNYIGIDLSPHPSGGGSPGQVILFGRDFDTKIVLWRGEGEGGWGRFLQHIAEELESGEMWTLDDEISSDSNDEEDAIGYDSYFSGGGSGAGRGGGDRGGDGGASFKLRGEYKGWPVLEAWADRSMRCWAEIGMPSGQPAWRSEQPPPSLVLQGAQDGTAAPDYAVDDPIDAAGSSQHVRTNGADGSTTRGGADASPHSSVAAAPGQSHPLEAPAAADGLHTTDSDPSSTSARRAADTLSPPPMHTSRMHKQKQREEHNSDASLVQQVRQRRHAPAPAAPLDLPTIDDVRAAHAAAMATQQRGGHYHYDVERAARPPPGMGGMGMGMGMSSDSTPGRYTSGRSAAAYAPRRSNADGLRMDVPTGEDDGVELENRSSIEAFNPSIRKHSGEQGLVSINDVRRGSASTYDFSPRASMNVPRLTSPSPHLSNGGRTLYSASRSSEAVDSLIDASSSPDVSIQIEGTKAAAGMHPALPAMSSPLASHSPVFSSSLAAAPDEAGTAGVKRDLSEAAGQALAV